MSSLSPAVAWLSPERAAPSPLWGASLASVSLWLVRVSEHVPALTEVPEVLDAQERARLAALVRQEDRDRYVVAHLALRRLLGGALNVAPAEVEVLREPCAGCGGPHGRPVVREPGVHFSLSHAGDLVLLGFAGVPVGVDVEEVPDAGAVAEMTSFLHPRERAELAALPAGERPEAFARCWTRKEAYLKATGTGLVEDPSVTCVGAGGEPAELGDWRVTDLEAPAGGYAAACAVRREKG